MIFQMAFFKIFGLTARQDTNILLCISRHVSQLFSWAIHNVNRTCCIDLSTYTNINWYNGFNVEIFKILGVWTLDTILGGFTDSKHPTFLQEASKTGENTREKCSAETNVLRQRRGRHASCSRKYSLLTQFWETIEDVAGYAVGTQTCSTPHGMAHPVWPSIEKSARKRERKPKLSGIMYQSVSIHPTPGRLKTWVRTIRLLGDLNGLELRPGDLNDSER